MPWFDTGLTPDSHSLNLPQQGRGEKLTEGSRVKDHEKTLQGQNMLSWEVQSEF